MPLSNNVPKKLVKIVLAVKVYADGDIERSVFDNLLGEEALAKTIMLTPNCNSRGNVS